MLLTTPHNCRCRADGHTLYQVKGANVEFPKPSIVLKSTSNWIIQIDLFHAFCCNNKSWLISLNCLIGQKEKHHHTVSIVKITVLPCVSFSHLYINEPVNSQSEIKN